MSLGKWVNVESVLHRPFTAEELRFRKFFLMGRPVTESTWSSALQAETSTVVRFRMSWVYPQHEVYTYDARTGFHSWPTEIRGSRARPAPQANEPLNHGSQKP